MNPLVVIYWLRLVLGIIAAFICTGYGLLTGTISSQNFQFNLFLNGLSIGITFYILSYYLIRLQFAKKVEEQQKLFTTGIGLYIISWFVFWTLLYTLIAV